MPAFTPPSVTLIIAAALGLINLWLSFRVGRVRLPSKIAIGDGGNEMLRARMRAHANFNEYVPIALILMLLIELRVGAATGLWVLGLALVVGRLVHPFGMERPVPNPLRGGGIALTGLASLALVIWAIYLAFTPAQTQITYF
ncbi:GST-like protein [Sphingomonas oleivorans]|uniref:GST-like protein n=1 Tax=Sphingomonas oleivorans TaxID=1735121 RepID=A0A2T5FXD5_9SPHN|nr:MAPEG family protein [Sphingomonas oleivorans]PTQ10793.1 GST-like protein [Sphingomonas oleivorans]